MSNLSISIKDIEVPKYWSSDSGKIKVKVEAKNSKGETDVLGHSATVAIHLSTDEKVDSLSDYVVNTAFIPSLKKKQKLTLKFNQFVSDPKKPYDLAVAPGRYYVHATVAGGFKDLDFGTQTTYTSDDYTAVSAPDSDVMIDWIGTVLTSTQLAGLEGIGDAPYNGNRLLAMTSLAAYDIVAADKETDRKPYLISSKYSEKFAPFDFSSDINAATAAINASYYKIMADQFANQKSLFKEQYKQTISELKEAGVDSDTIDQSVAYGRKVGAKYLKARKDDGTDDQTPFKYPLGSPDGFVWQPDTSGPAAGVAGGPNRGKVDPFVVPSIDQFTAAGNQKSLVNTTTTGAIQDLRDNYSPDSGDGSRYVEEYELSRIYGVRYPTPLTQNARNADETQIAAFYSQDENDSWNPWGLPNYIATSIALENGNSLQENAQFFAALHSAVTDATTVAWNDKYSTLKPRPSQVVTSYAKDDGFDQTVYDPSWLTGLTEIIPGQQDPPFPDYVSGHSDIYGSWSSVMDAYYGDNSDFDTFSSSSQTLEGTLRTYDGYDDPVTGNKNSAFKEFAMEAAQSRFFWGVHTPAGTGSAFVTGQNVGNYVMKEGTFGKPLTNPDFDGLPGWTQFAPEYTAYPVLPTLADFKDGLNNPIFGPSTIGTGD